MKHFCFTNKPRANMDSQNSPQLELEGRHHLHFLQYFLCLATGLEFKCHFVSKFLKLGLPQLWKFIIFCANFQLWWGLKQSYNVRRDISNNMWRATYTQINQGNSWFLVVRSQIGNLIPNFLLAISYVLNTQMDHASPF